MGCCGSKDGGSAKEVSLGDIADRPDVENMKSITECCGALWDIKDKWAAIRNSNIWEVDDLKSILKEFDLSRHDVCNLPPDYDNFPKWDGGAVPCIAKGLIAFIC